MQGEVREGNMGEFFWLLLFIFTRVHVKFHSWCWDEARDGRVSFPWHDHQEVW